MRILVADGDDFFRKVITEILTGAHHQVVLAHSGNQVLEKAAELRPELIILDVQLPGLLGTEVSQKLRDYSATAPIPVLLLSEGIEEVEVSRGDPKDFLADDFLLKPFLPEKLLDRVNRLAGKSSVFSSRGEGRPPRPAPAEERRRHPRVSIDVEVTVRTVEALMFHPMINISTGGLYLELDHPLPDDELLELRFSVPGISGLVSAEGQVAWCLELKKKGRWAAGVRFTQVDPESMERIRRYIDALLRVVRPQGEACTGIEDS